MDFNQDDRRISGYVPGSDGPGFGGLPVPVDLSGYAVPEGSGGLAGVPAGAGSDVSPGAGVAALSVVREAPVAMRGVGDACGQLCDTDLDGAARELLRARQEAERSLVLLLADAIGRGVVAGSDSGGARQWLLDRARFLEPGEASRITAAAEAVNRPENARLRAAFVAGDLSATMLVTVVREVPKAMVALPDAARDEVLGYYLQVIEPGFTRADLRGLTKRIIAEFGEDQAPADEEKAQRAESLSWTELASGLFELVAVLSPAHAAEVIEAITALSVPQPTKDPATGEKVRDSRTPGKRRADALVEIVGAAARCTDADAMRSTAKVIVTMGLDALLRRLGNGGFAVTATGQVLDAATARRLACSADLIPVVLGSDGQPLDVGRQERLFTGAVRTAIIVRDKHCSFPGCDRPPGWCEAHHVIPWWAGGQTLKDNGTLLCSRHHHVVHAKGYMARVSVTGVTWDLAPGQMPKEPPGTLADTA
ncbi:HNH endonuclease signature motif containing protein [Leekyejoonella antrihumi]|uniref:DUF222 domain-containing protein n=1 Tax=Leekyejoonella antrihumi TaxID=1660198 RepID=A0A563E0W4_9MICO|nr:HNH endonuclease signature motif containing protein [Leekyejoonella antrihumi]TWP35534.1 DUF222 domain-containing protein [Leekyejoonella antrihumi]